MPLVVLPARLGRQPPPASTRRSHARRCPGSNIPVAVSSPRTSVFLANLPGQAAIYLQWYLRWLHNSQAFRVATAARATLRGSQFRRAVQRGPATFEILWTGCGLEIL